MSASLPLNQSRTRWARHALEVFADDTGTDLYLEAAGNLISDIGHICDREGHDFLTLVQKAVAFWKMEQSDPVGISPPPDVIIIVGNTDFRS